MEESIRNKNRVTERTKNIFFWWVLFGGIIFSISIAYYRYFFRMSFPVFFETPCDPTTESCFLYECHPETEACSEDPRSNAYFYALQRMRAYQIKECTSVEECPEQVCSGGNLRCAKVFCDPETSDKERGFCFGPGMTKEEMQQYTLPPSEEVSPDEENVGEEGSEEETPANETGSNEGSEPAQNKPSPE